MLADQLAYLEVSVRKEDIFIIFFESLPSLYEYLIIALEMMPMKDLTKEYVMAQLIHEMSKCKKKEPQGKDVAMMSHHSKTDNPPLRQGIRMRFF